MWWRIDLSGEELLASFDSLALEKQKEINPNFEKTFIDKTEIIRNSLESVSQKNRLIKLSSEYSKAYREREINSIFFSALMEFVNLTKGDKRNTDIRAIFLSFLKIPPDILERNKYKKIKKSGRPTVLEKCGLMKDDDFLSLLKELYKLKKSTISN